MSVAVGKAEGPSTASHNEARGCSKRNNFTCRPGPVSCEITYAAFRNYPVIDPLRQQPDSRCANNKGITEIKTNNVTPAERPPGVCTGRGEPGRPALPCPGTCPRPPAGRVRGRLRASRGAEDMGHLGRKEWSWDQEGPGAGWPSSLSISCLTCCLRGGGPVCRPIRHIHASPCPHIRLVRCPVAQVLGGDTEGGAQRLQRAFCPPSSEVRGQI